MHECANDIQVIDYLQELLKPRTEQITIGAIPPETIDLSCLKYQQIKRLGKVNDNAVTYVYCSYQNAKEKLMALSWLLLQVWLESGLRT